MFFPSVWRCLRKNLGRFERSYRYVFQISRFFFKCSQEISSSSENVLRIFLRESHQVRLDVSIHQEKNSIQALSIFDPKSSQILYSRNQDFSVFRETSEKKIVGGTVEEDQNVVPTNDFTTPTRNKGGG